MKKHGLNSKSYHKVMERTISFGEKERLLRLFFIRDEIEKAPFFVNRLPIKGFQARSDKWQSEEDLLVFVCAVA
jgi:hypothetical protein